MNLTQAIQLIWCLAFPPADRPACESTIAANVAIVERIAPEYGVSPVLLSSLCIKESRLGADPRAVSVCGTRWHHRYITDPETSIRMAANTLSRHHCRSLLRSLGSFRGVGCAPTQYGRDILDIRRRINCTISSGRRCQ